MTIYAMLQGTHFVNVYEITKTKRYFNGGPVPTRMASERSRFHAEQGGWCRCLYRIRVIPKPRKPHETSLGPRRTRSVAS